MFEASAPFAAPAQHIHVVNIAMNA